MTGNVVFDAVLYSVTELANINAIRWATAFDCAPNASESAVPNGAYISKDALSG